MQPEFDFNTTPSITIPQANIPLIEDKNNTNSAYNVKALPITGGLLRAIQHTFNVVFSGSFLGGRISKGEFLLGTVFLIFLETLGSLSGAGILLSLVAFIYNIRLWVRRSHDLNKSGRYALPLIILQILTVIVATLTVLFFRRTVILGLSDGGGRLTSLTGYMSNEIQKLFEGKPSFSLITIGVILLFNAIWFIITMIVLFCFSGTSGKNNYGEDPLLQQPISNGSYWILGILMTVFSLTLPISNIVLWSKTEQRDITSQTKNVIPSNNRISPERERDMYMLATLSKVNAAVNAYFYNHNTLPGSLSDIKPWEINVIPKDVQLNKFLYKTERNNYVVCVLVEEFVMGNSKDCSIESLGSQISNGYMGGTQEGGKYSIQGKKQ